MRILHVTPHLPPDQAANALLPCAARRTGRSDARRRGRIRRASTARGRQRRSSPARSTWIPRRSRRRSSIARCTSGSTLAALRMRAMLAPAIARADRGPRPQQRPARGDGRPARAAQQTSRSCSRCTARRSGTTRRKRCRSGPVHARVPRRVIRHVLQRSADEPGARARARPAQRAGRVPAGRAAVRMARRRTHRAARGRRSASAIGTCC